MDKECKCDKPFEECKLPFHRRDGKLTVTIIQCSQCQAETLKGQPLIHFKDCPSQPPSDREGDWEAEFDQLFRHQSGNYIREKAPDFIRQLLKQYQERIRELEEEIEDLNLEFKEMGEYEE